MKFSIQVEIEHLCEVKRLIAVADRHRAGAIIVLLAMAIAIGGSWIAL